MVEPILWIAGVGVLAFFLLIPASIHLLKTVLTDEDESHVERRRVRSGTGESSSRRDGTGT